MSTVYESIILFGVVFFFGYGYSALVQFRGEPGAARTGFQLLMFLVLGAYFTGFWARGRWTLPMKTMGVTLVDSAGRPLSHGRAAWRYLIASILFWGLAGLVWKASPWWLVVWPLPFAWALFDARSRTLYDLLAGTMLVRREVAAAKPADSSKA